MIRKENDVLFWWSSAEPVVLTAYSRGHVVSLSYLCPAFANKVFFPLVNRLRRLLRWQPFLPRDRRSPNQLLLSLSKWEVILPFAHQHAPDHPWGCIGLRSRLRMTNRYGEP